jgi:hypothetical protein
MKTAPILVCLLAGCTAVGPSPEQLKAMEGSQSSLCIESPGWNGSPVKVHYAAFGGKSTGTAGGGGDATCGSSVAKFVNDGRAKAASAP